jgi:hypothetical protein
VVKLLVLQKVALAPTPNLNWLPSPNLNLQRFLWFLGDVSPRSIYANPISLFRFLEGIHSFLSSPIGYSLPISSFQKENQLRICQEVGLTLVASLVRNQDKKLQRML